MSRRITACLAVLAIGVASVLDNPASCPDESSPSTGKSSGKAPDDSCAGMPCQTPGDEPAPLVVLPVFVPEAAFATTSLEPSSADTPAPPTPPPTIA